MAAGCVVTDSTAIAAARGGGMPRTCIRRAAAGRDRRTSYDDGVRGEPGARRGGAGDVPPVSTSRPVAGASWRGLRAAAAAQGAEEIVSIHLSAEVSATYESAHARGPRGTGAGASPWTAGRSGSAPGSRCWPPRRCRARRERCRGRGRGAPRRGPRRPRPVLRRHARVPAPRRPGRSRGCPARVGAGGQAAAQIEDGRIVPLEKVRTAEPGDRPAAGARRSRRAGTRTPSRSSSLTWAARTGRPR